MMALALISLISIDHSAGFARLEGQFEGTMAFYDTFAKERRSFPISLRWTPFSDGATALFKYRFQPGQYQLSIGVISVSMDGTVWLDRNSSFEVERFDLSNWAEFCAGRSDWFQIETDRESEMGNSRMRFRYTFTKDGFVSDKSLLWAGKSAWEFSHRMELKRVKPNP
ncbi:MAG: hypothetical protein JNJ45_11125 [Chthonomonas sp.]|nr:hypothetical protein [Chthonomonas sp.]